MQTVQSELRTRQTADALRETKQLVIAGWAGRNQEAVLHHIEELKALGIKPPPRVPCYYRVGANLLTLDRAPEFIGGASSGEVEMILFALADGLWVGIASDHTDRKVEAYSITISKQACPKPVGPLLWRYDDVRPHWDNLITRSYVVENGRRVLYQEGVLSALQPPEILMEGSPISEDGRLPTGTALFLGTHAAIGGIRASTSFEMEVEDPILGRRIAHSYTVSELPGDEG